MESAVLNLPIRIAFFAVSIIALQAPTAVADEAQISRGKYLVVTNGCNDCHTPGYLFGKPDLARYLGGSDVGFEIPGLGVFVGPNITPDKETGIGNWTQEQIVTAIQGGQRPDGRVLAPIMPYSAFANFTAEDAMAIAAFLRSVPPVSNQVPGPFKPGEKVSAFMFRIMPPGETAAAAP